MTQETSEDERPQDYSKDSPLWNAIIDTAKALTPRWQSFDDNPASDEEKTARQRLVLASVAQCRLAYKIQNMQTGQWIRQHFVVQGNFMIPIMPHIAAQCPVDWFDQQTFETKPGIIAHVDESQPWDMAITPEANKLRTPGDDWHWLMVNMVMTLNARPTIRKYKTETGFDAIPQTVAEDKLVTVEDVAAMLTDVEAKTLRNTDSKLWGSPDGKINRSNAWKLSRILPIVLKSRRLKDA